MAILEMLIGLSGAGKSFYTKQGQATIFSSDQIREELWGDANDQREPEKVFNLLHKRIRQALINGDHCIYDATNLSMKKRRIFLESIKLIPCEKQATVIITPIETCIENDRKRERHVGSRVIQRQYRQFEVPMYQEGWDRIVVVQNFQSFDLYGRIKSLKNFNQDNPNHTLTLGGHTDKVLRHLWIYNASEETKFAGLYHDIGKVETKIFKNAKGEDSEIAHYYSHQNVGAYLVLLGSPPTDFSLKIAALVQHHMLPYFLSTDKACDKWKNFFGEEFWTELMLLHEADQFAH